MAGLHRRAPDRCIRRLRIRAVLAGGLVLGLGATATLAAWTDDEHARSSVEAARFGIEGTVNGTTYAEHPVGSPATLSWTPTTPPFIPGATTYARFGVRTIAASAAGTVTFQQPTLDGVATTGAEGVADQALLGALRYSVRVVTTPTADCAAVFAGSQGTALVTSQRLDATIAPAAQSLPAAGASGQTYCMQLVLPADAASAAQGGAFGITWRFTGST